MFLSKFKLWQQKKNAGHFTLNIKDAGIAGNHLKLEKRLSAHLQERFTIKAATRNSYINKIFIYFYVN